MTEIAAEGPVSTTTVINNKNGTVPVPHMKMSKRSVSEDFATTFSSPAAWLLVVALIVTWSAVAIVMFDLVDYRTLAGQSINKLTTDPLRIMHGAVEESTNSIYGFLSLLSDLIFEDEDENGKGEGQPSLKVKEEIQPPVKKKDIQIDKAEKIEKVEKKPIPKEIQRDKGREREEKIEKKLSLKEIHKEKPEKYEKPKIVEKTKKLEKVEKPQKRELTKVIHKEKPERHEKVEKKEKPEKQSKDEQPRKMEKKEKAIVSSKDKTAKQEKKKAAPSPKELNQDNVSAALWKENTQNKVYSNEEKASRMELPYCIGEIDFLATRKKQGKFLKVPCAIHPGVIFDLMSNKWNLPAPNLVVSFVGEEEHFQMKPWLRDTLRKGLVKAAQSTGAWIFTSALHVGITKHIGQAVQDHMLTSSSSTVKVVAIGITSLEKIQQRDLLDDVKNDILISHKTDNNVQGPLYSLDNHHSHFILVEESEPDGTTKLQLTLEKYISEQHTSYGGTGSIEIPVLCLLVNGRPHILERIFRGLKNSIPCLILAGSGGIADILAALMSEPHLIVPQVVEKQLKQKFPTENFTWNDAVHWTEMILSIITQKQLLTIHYFEQEGSEELDTVILKALVKACKSHSQEAQEYLDELKLAVAWNRVDIAKSEIFNGDVEWKSCDLEEVLMDALVNDKPEFVKLFIDNGANIYNFLTYSRLQSLYCNISPKSLLYMLLLKKHEENRLTLAGMSGQHHKEVVDACPLFTLHEVSRVLKDFLHDACRGFYHDQKPGGKRKVDKTNARKFPSLFDMNQKCENPWRDLFLWAVLQNRHKMAHLFWAMGPEGVAAALAACQIVREMSHLETEAEVVRRMKEAKYEQLAVELFSECYHDSEERAFALLVRKNRYWSKMTCLHLATEADAKSFFAHDGVQAFLTKIWWGDMSTSTPILNLICGFGCPFLIYTNLISFSEETQSVEDSESFKDLDSLDTERTLLSYTKTKADARLEAEPASGNITYATFMFTRWKKFWTAPVTVFMGNVVMYFAFLFLFAYVLLVDFKPPPKGPAIKENILYFWVFTLVLEEIRQSFFTDEGMNLIKKFKLYVEDNWNKCDMLAISLFMIGIICRMFNSTFHDGRTILAIDFMVFTLRLIHIFAIHKQLGPKIIIVERMMKDVFFFLFFLSVWLIAYGVATQALLYPDDSRAEWIFRRVLYRPYLQIFGQIPLDKIDSSRMDFENCTSDQQTASDSLCPSAYANWLVIILLVIFLLVTNVLLMNLLIAMFSYTFQVVQGNADIFWKFQRYNLIVEYHGRPAFAPPFIIIDHVKLFLRRLKKTEHKKEYLERDIPEELDQKLITWEMLQKENYLANLETKKKESNEEKLKKMSDKVDSLLKNFSGLKEQEKQLRSLESQISYCTIMLSSVADTLVKNSSFFSRPTSNYTRIDQMVVPENEDGIDTSQFDDVMYIDN